MKKNSSSPSIKMRKSSNFKQIYCISASEAFTPFDFSVGFYNDHATIEDPAGRLVIDRTINAEIIMSPVAAKSLEQWLNGHINDFEKKFGAISIPKQFSNQNDSKRKGTTDSGASMWT